MTVAASITTSCRDYLELCKPRVVLLIVFTAMVGMFMACPGLPPAVPFLFGTLGIGLSAAGAAVINHVADHRIDALMARTEHRPLPQGQIDKRNALLFATILTVLGMFLLVTLVNVITAVLTFSALIGYAVIYTLYLKRATPQNIVIGGAAGAAPPVLGWVAMTGTLDPNALLLFLIIFAWTPPHFWSLAIYRRKEYAKVQVPMLPITHGVDFTRQQILLYTIILIVVSVMPYLTYMSGALYLSGALALGAVFLSYTVRMQWDHSDALAIKTFGFSIVYLTLLFLSLFVDHYVPLFL